MRGAKKVGEPTYSRLPPIPKYCTSPPSQPALQHKGFWNMARQVLLQDISVIGLVPVVMP